MPMQTFCTCVREGLVTQVQILGFISEFESDPKYCEAAFIGKIMWLQKNLCTSM